ncbi:beta-propeller domain-containing protein [Spirosoma flavum]|uniref:PQQ-binding-like beta-propeller repeat protein n=1 Tax=Spirosoma flavum TaxID=2048557 RepID=A0ABW6AJD9_9BACT
MNTKSVNRLFFILGLFLVVRSVVAQDSNVIDKAGKPLQGNGLKNRSLLYVGEWDTRNPDSQKMSPIRKGKVVWQHTIPLHPSPVVNQEFDDITLLPNGNIVYAQMSGAGIITPDKKLIWKFDCPPGSETHSCQPIGKDSVLMVLNANPAKVLIINTATSKTLKEIRIPTSTTSTHGQFRHVRMTKTGTILVPLLSEGRVVEYTLDGKEVWSVEAKSPWSAIRLDNGNTLISGDWSGYTREVDPSGKTVWDLTQADVPFKLYNTQTANRLANGNTIICNWVGGKKNGGMGRYYSGV